MSRAGTWVKMIGVGLVMCVGGPMFVQYIRPSDEELFKRYNPELQKKSLEGRERREQEFDDYVNKLKEWSKSDKSIWFVVREEENRRRAAIEAARASPSKEEERIQREEMRRELQGGK